jgi:putative methionine-R-sulfoxide reductase with GAF domain
VFGVLDIDSEKVGTFDETDKKFLEILVNRICKSLNK